MASLSALTHQLKLYTEDDSIYLQIAQDGTTPSQINFKCRNAAGDGFNSAYFPHFDDISFKEGLTKVVLSARLGSIDATISGALAAVGADIATINEAISEIPSIQANLTAEISNRAAADTAEVNDRIAAVSSEADARSIADGLLSDAIDAINAEIITIQSRLNALEAP